MFYHSWLNLWHASFPPEPIDLRAFLDGHHYENDAHHYQNFDRASMGPSGYGDFDTSGLSLLARVTCASVGNGAIFQFFNSDAIFQASW
jgi:hypothetical protein